LSNLSYQRSTFLSAGCAIENVLASFPVVCFSLALATDIIYWRTSYLMWQHFSAWLLLIGLVVGVAALITRLVGYIVCPACRPRRVWLYTLGSVLALLLAFLNNFVHAADGWKAVVPHGLLLSALTVLVMLVTGWLGLSRPARPGDGTHV